MKLMKSFGGLITGPLLTLLIITAAVSSSCASSERPPKNDFFRRGKSTPVSECIAGKDSAPCETMGISLTYGGEPVHLNISSDSGYIVKEGIEIRNPVIEIGYETDGKQEKPLVISIPEELAGSRAVFFSVRDDNSLDLLTSSGPDTKGAYRIYSFKRLTFTWINLESKAD